MLFCSLFLSLDINTDVLYYVFIRFGRSKRLRATYRNSKENTMKRFIAIVIFALIAVAVATPSFAKEKKAVHEPIVIKLTEEKAPKIVRFIGNGDEKNMHDNETRALNQAQKWLDANYKNVRVISHSVTGNYRGSTGTSAHGFSTVTILYEEK